ncbi:hypothetical protein A2572_01345 [Candidatus Collierbacteria bacterium RIFOXYD1_FULL_40_9]|uniref:Penicillin-binding protein transpeptidase domain-containing protein n=1 Tax=Candidatus Collierbacteria bacterium RIFOXYD1_FULL_40_9 TaxID=1817731 RepID=A0A1F5FVL4_9BACT|nr:MAG: hypothetical protein A2572_01345 [Candidatus Collierbacteria bacterium RIFOXYD1_FULL_40_9]
MGLHLTNNLQDRLRIITIFIPVIFVILLVRLFYWQILRGPELKAKASKQHETVITLKARRGDILDRDGSLLGGSKGLYHLYLYKPQLKISEQQLIDSLTPLIVPTAESSTSAEIKELLESRITLTSNWVSIKHFLTPEEKEKIENLKITGLGFEEEYVRFYPEASLSAHLLGFVGQDMAGQEQGYFGIEGFFDRQLKGREGKVRTEKDAVGNPILIGNYQFYHATEGKDIKTSIDKSIQYIAEKYLKEGIEKYQASAGNIVIMEPSTGKIRASASLPNYDPNNFSKFPSDYYKNPVVADLFEPGSIFKVLVMAAGLNEKVVTPDTQCDNCGSPVQIGKYSIRTWDEKYRPNITMTETIVNSDNTGMVYVANKLGGKKFADYLRLFGFGKKTDAGLQDEVSGKVIEDGEKYREIDLATNSFGQGIAVTPIQMLAAVNTIANKGTYVKPTVLEEIATESWSVLNQNAVGEITEIMKKAVENGEAKWSKPKGLSVAGKTGTAQIPIEGHYDPDKTIASFIGFFPADNPKYTMLVSLREPKTSIWGSETAAPLWFQVAKHLLL